MLNGNKRNLKVLEQKNGKQNLQELKQNALENLKSRYLKKQEDRLAQIKDLDKILKAVGLTDSFTFSKLKEQIFEAKTIAPDGSEIPDFNAMLHGIKIWKKLKGYNKKGLSLEDLLGIDGKMNYLAQMHKLLDEIGLDDKSVFTQLKYIMEHAFVIIPTAGGTFRIAKYNKIINDAIKEYATLKDYIEDDTLNALNLLKVDNHVKEIIFNSE